MLFCFYPPGGVCSWTLTRLSSCWWTATAWSLSRLRFPRCTSASGMRTAFCTWSTPPRRRLGGAERTKPSPGFQFRTLILIRSLAPVLLPDFLPPHAEADVRYCRTETDVFPVRFAQSWFQIIHFISDLCLWLM